MKRILLSTDFSDNALNAIQYAISLFKNRTVTFYVFNAYERFEMGSQNKGIAEERLLNLTTKLQIGYKNLKHNFEQVFVVDELITALRATIIDKKIDYLIMGTKGSSSLQEIFMGSNAVRALQQLDFCPIIFVPENYRYSDQDHIMIATDFSNFYERTELQPVIAIAEHRKAPLTVVHIVKDTQLSTYQESLKKMLEKRLQNIDHSLDEVVSSDPLRTTIYQLIKERKISLLAMIHRRYCFFEKMMKPNVIKKIVFDIEVPFLVLPEAD